MPYVEIEDFKSGLDRRKLSAASPPGSLQVLTNAHITRGGEIEKRLAFVPKYSLPAGQTFGFAGAAGKLYVFAASDVSVPSGITCQALPAQSGAAMSGISTSEFFNGKLFVAAHYADSSTACFYDGTRVSDWDPTSSVSVIAGKTPSALLTVKSKIYATVGSQLAFCGSLEPTHWDTATPGASFITMSNQAAGFEDLTALGRYQGYLAVFARRNTQIWYLDPDPLQNAQRQVVANIGTFAPRSVVNFGEIDVIFLSDTGIRSLKVRDASNQAGVSDIGTPIDDEVVAYLRELTDIQKAAAAGVQEPIDGRCLMAIGERIYVFSYYPSSRISSWSRYDPGFQVDNWVQMDGRVWARSGDTIYLLGGDDGQTYDTTPVVVETPYIDGRREATWKKWTGFDMVSEGEWLVEINTDPNLPDAWSRVAMIKADSKATVTGMDIGMVGDSPLVKLRLTNTRTGPAKIAKLFVHYEQEEAH